MNLSETAYLAPTLDPAARVLMDAAELIERDGWCRGALQRDGKHCAMHAICVSGPQDVAQRVRAMERFRDTAGCLGISCWNDAPGRTAAEVIATLRRAAGQ